MPTVRQALESKQALDVLLSNKDELRSITSPTGVVVAREFVIEPAAIAAAMTYPVAERRLIVEQLQLMLTGFYVYLERKKAIYGFDPVRALQLLEGAIETISDGEFHQSVTQLIARTRDRHLSFTGKAPFGATASLGLMIERCFENGKEVYVVTKVSIPTKKLKVGARVLNWNNIPIDRFIRLNANILDGGNEAASLARSVLFLTERPLGRFGPPLEQWVDLRFDVDGSTLEERFNWKGIDTTQIPVFPSIGRNLIGFGGDLDLFHLHRVRRIQFSPSSFDPLPPEPTAEPNVPNIIGKALNGLVQYGDVKSDSGTFAYVRLRHFQVGDVEAIVEAFLSFMPELPRNGMIIDLRGNAGGRIAAGERLLQLFTSTQIMPSRFQFRVTSATRAMVKATKSFDAWRHSFEESFATGEPFTKGFPIEGTDGDANKVGQRYFGPVVVVTDPLAFSTADMFVAGFIDHKIGRVICIDQNMAAAGGNNWFWPVFRMLTPDFRIDLSFNDALDENLLPPELRHAFNANHVSLSDEAVVAEREEDDGDITWSIADGALQHTVRYASWIDDAALLVYQHRGKLDLSDLPSGVIVSFTVRRCIRVAKNEGRLLEDVGIEPDIVYQMTFKDITEKNQDLMARACQELAQMPAYDLEVSITQDTDGHILSCSTLNIEFLQLLDGQRHVADSAVSKGTATSIRIPSGVTDLTVEGLQADRVVARLRLKIPQAA